MNRSTSLSSRASPRAVDPNRYKDVAPSARISAARAFRVAMMSAVVIPQYSTNRCGVGGPHRGSLIGAARRSAIHPAAGVPYRSGALTDVSRAFVRSQGATAARLTDPAETRSLMRRGDQHDVGAHHRNDRRLG